MQSRPSVHDVARAPSLVELFATSSELPDFFVLGAQKAGTTSLDAWLRAVPGVDLPRLKETHYLSDDERYAKGLAWYLARFAGTPGLLRGEVDPDYLGDPRVPERLEALFGGRPAPKLVVVLRDPLARAFSHWKMIRRRGLEARPFAVALAASWRDEDGGIARDPDHDYYTRGLYSHHLARWRTVLPTAPLHLVTFDELVGEERREATWDGLVRFLGLPASAPRPDFDAVANPAGRPRSQLVNKVLHRRSRLRSLLGRLVPSQDLRLHLGVLLERANTAPEERPERLEGALPRGPLDGFAAELARLRPLLAGEQRADLDRWAAHLDRHREAAA